MANNVAEYLRQNSEKIWLVVYFVVILVLTAPLSQMLGSAWESANLPQTLLYLPGLIGVDFGAVTGFFFGMFLGLLVLMTIDPKKRWQGMLLWIGVVVGLIGLSTMDLFLTNLDLTEEAGWIIGGVVLGIIAGGGRKLLDIQDTDVFEFRRASIAIYYVIIVIVAVAFAEYHIQYPEVFEISQGTVETKSVDSSAVEFITDSLVQNVIVSGLFVVTIRQFVQYDAQQDFFVLGPRASGKSLFLTGAYLEALERSRNDDSRTPMNPSQDLMEIVEALDQRRTEWILEATARGQVNILEFQYVQGSVFPKNVRLSGVDYAGEYLSLLPDALTGAIPENEGDEALWELVEQIEETDTLLLMIDVERYVNQEPLEISEYFSILQSADIESVLLIATKADFLAEQFREDKNLEAYQYFDDFKEYVNQELRQNNQVDTLIQETAGADIHPVYFQTRENDQGDKVPMRDDSGTVMTVGYDQLLDRLGGR